MSVNLKADSNFRPAAVSSIEALIVPKIIEAVKDWTGYIFGLTQERVPVDTGELRASGQMTVTMEGKAVNGAVAYSAEHAAYVEFGTGVRGAASPGAGQVTYNPSWKGMPAQPYLRPALDQGRGYGVQAFSAVGITVG